MPAGDDLNNFQRPPLAIELFEDRPVFAEAIERYPECQPIVPRLRSPRGETLEAALEDLQAKADSYARGVQQLAAVRFLKILTQNLRRGVQLHIVGGPRPVNYDAPGEEIKIRICSALLNNPPSSASVDPGGFTDFILNRRAEQFLGN